MVRHLSLLIVVAALACSRPVLDDPAAADDAGGGAGAGGAGGYASPSRGAAAGASATGATGVTQADPQARGARCTRGDECASGFCADGVCCNVACTGACITCALPAALGTCTPVAIGSFDPHAACAAQAPESCGTDGTCDGLGACRLYAAGTVCAPAACIDALLSPESTCDGNGACLAQGLKHRCAPFTCEPGAARCRSVCTADPDCTDGFVCLSGTCLPAPPPLPPV